MMKKILVLVVFVFSSCVHFDSKGGREPAVLEKVVQSLNLDEKRDLAISSTLLRSDLSATNFVSKPDEIPDKFDISVNKLGAQEFFLSLVQDTDINMLVHPSVTGEISLSLKNVSLEEVLDIVQNIYNFIWIRSSNGYEILPPGELTKIYEFQYLIGGREGNSSLSISSTKLSSDSNGSNGTSISTKTANNIWVEVKEVLDQILSSEQGSSINISEQTGMIIVSASSRTHKKIKEFLDNALDSLFKQVVLEAKIVEVRLKDRYEHGIDWGTLLSDNFGLAQRGINAFTETGANDFSAANGNLFTGGAGGPISSIIGKTAAELGGIFSVGLQNVDFGVLLNLLNTQGNVQILSSPLVTAMNNQKAVIKVGEESYQVTDVTLPSNSTTEAGTTTRGAPQVNFASFFSGISLDVTPSIDSKGGVMLHIHPAITEITTDNKDIKIGGDTYSYPLAKNSVRESDSLIRAQNGQVVIIGGLMKDNVVEKANKLPILGDIPYLGTLFRSVQQERNKSELIIFLRPTIVGLTTSWHDLNSSKIEHLRALDRGFLLGAKPEVFGTLGEKR